MRLDYTARLSKDKVQPTRAPREVFRRRTLPFIDSAGVDRPLSFILEEVYLQGIRDAVEVMEAKNDQESRNATADRRKGAEGEDPQRDLCGAGG